MNIYAFYINFHYYTFILIKIYNNDPCYKLAWCFDASLQYQTLRIKVN